MGVKKSKLKRPSKYEGNGPSACGSDIYSDSSLREFQRIHTDRVSCVAACKPALCLSGSSDTNIAIFDCQAGRLCTRWKGHDKDVSKVCCGTYKGQPIVFSGSRDKSIKSWFVSDNYAIQLKSVCNDAHELVVTAVDTNSDCSILCSGSRDNCIKLWNTETDQCMKTMTVTRNLITCVKWFPDDNLIAQTGEDKMLRLWDSRSLETAFVFPPKQYFATCCDVSNDGRFVLTSSNGFNGNGCEIVLWDVRGKKQVYTYHGHAQTVSSCSFLPRLTEITSWPLIISASHDSTVKVWNQETQKCLATESFLGSGVLNDLATWDDGRFCVCTSEAGIYQLRLGSDGEGGAVVKCEAHF